MDSILCIGGFQDTWIYHPRSTSTSFLARCLKQYIQYSSQYSLYPVSTQYPIYLVSNTLYILLMISESSAQWLTSWLVTELGLSYSLPNHHFLYKRSMQLDLVLNDFFFLVNSLSLAWSLQANNFLYGRKYVSIPALQGGSGTFSCELVFATCIGRLSLCICCSLLSPLLQANNFLYRRKRVTIPALQGGSGTFSCELEGNWKSASVCSQGSMHLPADFCSVQSGWIWKKRYFSDKYFYKTIKKYMFCKRSPGVAVFL